MTGRRASFGATPELRALVRRTIEFACGRRRVPHPHAVRSLCRFAKWVARHLAPALSRFDHALTTLEAFAEMTLRGPVPYANALVMFGAVGTAAVAENYERIFG